jgi:small-conductance mechanosensitive channel
MISFFTITSGSVYCIVTGISMVGYSQNDDGEMVLSWISTDMSEQFIAEGIIAALCFTLCAAALIVSFYEIVKPNQDKAEIDDYLRQFAFTAPLWLICIILVFRMKIPAYFPSFFKMHN